MLRQFYLHQQTLSLWLVPKQSQINYINDIYRWKMTIFFSVGYGMVYTKNLLVVNLQCKFYIRSRQTVDRKYF